MAVALAMTRSTSGTPSATASSPRSPRRGARRRLRLLRAWLASFERLLLDTGIVAADELDARTAEYTAGSWKNRALPDDADAIARLTRSPHTSKTRNIVWRADGEPINVFHRPGQLFVCATGCCYSHAERGHAERSRSISITANGPAAVSATRCTSRSAVASAPAPSRTWPSSSSAVTESGSTLWLMKTISWPSSIMSRRWCERISICRRPRSWRRTSLMSSTGEGWSRKRWWRRRRDAYERAEDGASFAAEMAAKLVGMALPTCARRHGPCRSGSQGCSSRARCH